MGPISCQLDNAISEASYKDYIDDQAFEYALKELERAKQAGVASQMEIYSRKASKATDKFSKLFYEFRCYYPASIAQKLV